MSWRWGVVLLLLVHGAIVAAQASGVPRSWVVGNHGSTGAALTLIAGALLVAAGAALAAQSSAWRPLALAGAGMSFAFFVVYFQPLILIGLGIDISMLLAIGWFAWPTADMVGA
jgi:hypothetical protein